MPPARAASIPGRRRHDAGQAARLVKIEFLSIGQGRYAMGRWRRRWPRSCVLADCRLMLRARSCASPGAARDNTAMPMIISRAARRSRCFHEAMPASHEFTLLKPSGARSLFIAFIMPPRSRRPPSAAGHGPSIYGVQCRLLRCLCHASHAPMPLRHSAFVTK